MPLPLCGYLYPLTQAFPVMETQVFGPDRTKVSSRSPFPPGLSAALGAMASLPREGNTIVCKTTRQPYTHFLRPQEEEAEMAAPGHPVG